MVPFLFALICAPIGAALLSISVMNVHAMILREALADGQYFLLGAMTIPLGCILGTGSGYGVALVWYGEVAPAARAWTISGCLILIVAVFYGVRLLAGRFSSGRPVSERSFYFRLYFPIWALSAWWSLILIFAAWRT